ncbi:MAG: TolC family protein [Myxococcales bacterium]|nr:TolC family protein [Myxococcales bacterium]
MWIVPVLAGMVVAEGCAFSDAARRGTMLEEIARYEGERDSSAGGEVTLGDPLDRARLVRAVLARNPDLDAALHAWRAALERQPQADALPDPRLEYSFAPLSIGAQNVDYGQVITVRQEFPFPGRLSLRSAVAIAEAAAAREDYATARLQLAVMAAQLYDGLYAIERALEINDEQQRLLEDIRAMALDQLTAGRANQDAPLQAELDLRRVQLERIQLVAQQSVVAARLNGLLHRAPETPLPPTVARLDVTAEQLPSTAALQARALDARPELRAASHRVDAREAARELAEHEQLPDFGVMASYNSMWGSLEHQLMVGVSVTIPLQIDSHVAAIREQDALSEEARARREAVVDRIRVEVEEARAHVVHARGTLTLIEGRMLPTARDQLEAARAAYVTGRATFQPVIDAERSLRTLELERLRAEADLHTAEANLIRAIGAVPGIDSLGSMGGAR